MFVLILNKVTHTHTRFVQHVFSSRLLCTELEVVDTEINYKKFKLEKDLVKTVLKYVLSNVKLK